MLTDSRYNSGQENYSGREKISEMKLSKEAKREENENLKRFVRSANAIVREAENSKSVGNLTADERALFGIAFGYLDRELDNRAQKGRRQKADAPEIRDNILLFKEGRKTLEEVLQALKISRATFYRYLEKAEKSEAEETEKREALRTAKDKIEIFRRIADTEKKIRLKATEIENLKNGLQIIKAAQSAWQNRQKAAAVGRDELSRVLAGDSEAKERINKSRRKNLLRIVKTRTKEDERTGGRRGGAARAGKLSARERSRIAKSGAEARWKKNKEQ